MTMTLNHEALSRRVRTGARWALVLAALAGAGLSVGCRDERTDSPPRQILPDMDDSPKYKAQGEADFFEDGRSLRQPVAGTVAFGHSDHAADTSRFWHLKDDPAIFEGIDVSVDPAKNEGLPGYVAMIPDAVFGAVVAEQVDRGNSLDKSGAMDWLIKRGHERFNIYCSACHGYNGEGGGQLPDGSGYGGLVGRRWGAPVPSFHDFKYKDRTLKTGKDGYIFNVIKHGVPAGEGLPPKMPAYADKVNTRDAWAIVAYLRVLQKSYVAPAGSSYAAPPAPAATPAPKPAAQAPALAPVSPVVDAQPSTESAPTQEASR